MASRNGGRTIGSAIITRAVPLKGRSVRSTSQAIMPPVKSAHTVQPTAKMAVLPTSL